MYGWAVSTLQITLTVFSVWVAVYGHSLIRSGITTSKLIAGRPLPLAAAHCDEALREGTHERLSDLPDVERRGIGALPQAPPGRAGPRPR